MIAIVLSFVVLLFGAHSEYGTLAQLAAVMLIIGATISVLVTKRHLAFKFEPALIFWILVVAMPVQSAMVGLFRGTFYQVSYALIFMLMAFSCRVLVVWYGAKVIIYSYLIAAAIMASLCLAFELSDLDNALAVTMTDRGLFRFSPFENHPNLTGHIFGLAAVISFGSLLVPHRKVIKFSIAAVGLISLLFVLASSSRGGLFAAIISLGLILTIWAKDNFFERNNRWPLIVMLFIFISFSVGLLLQSDIWFYLTELLQLDSTTRGLDSGLTGRTAAWPAVFNKVLEDAGAVFWGFGFRSWDTWAEGDLAIDNSYVELIHDFGYPIAVLFFIQFLMSIRCFAAPRRIYSVAYIIVGAAFFALAESIVTRYMVGIGNPASLFIMFLLCSIDGQGYFHIVSMVDQDQKYIRPIVRFAENKNGDI